VRTGVRQPATCRPRRHSPLVEFAERRARPPSRFGARGLRHSRGA
jgi:hypothetical protein